MLQCASDMTDIAEICCSAKNLFIKGSPRPQWVVMSQSFKRDKKTIGPVQLKFE